MKTLRGNLVGVFVAGLILFMMVPVRMNSARAFESHPLNSMWVDPAEVDFTTGNATLGTRFNVTVWANLENSTFYWLVKMTYNSTLLQVTKAGYTAGETSQFFSGKEVIPMTEIVNKAGFLFAGESLLGWDYRVGGMGSLFFVEFQVATLPNATQISLASAIHINDTDNTFFLNNDASGSEMGLTIYDGKYSILSLSPFDMNSDGVIDLKDIAIAASAFGSTPTGPKWNTKADINNDGKVDLRDIGMIARYFGQRYS